MNFTSQTQAKKYFIDKVLLQAQKEHINISAAEKHMLSWTEVENDFTPNQDLIDQFNKETTDKEFEKKIIKLLKNAYVIDISNDNEAKKTYDNAYKALKEGDHYLLIMIEEALKGRTSKNNFISWIKDRMLLWIVGVIVSLGAFVFFALLDKFNILEWGGFISGSVFYLGTMYVLFYKLKPKKDRPNGLQLIILLLVVFLTLSLSFLLFYFEIIPDNDSLCFLGGLIAAGTEYYLSLLFKRRITK